MRARPKIVKLKNVSGPWAKVQGQYGQASPKNLYIILTNHSGSAGSKDTGMMTLQQSSRTFWFLCLLCGVLVGLASAGAQAECNGMTARGVFTMLPVSIFENTAEGLSDAEKQTLLAEGQSEFWEVAGESEDVIVFAALPLRDSAVALRLFRNTADGSVRAAIGTLGRPICTLELWRVDVDGRAVPVDTPPEPAINEFLAAGQKLPPGVQPTVLMCLGLGGLKAQPVFWNSTGMTQIPVSHDVSYQWNGRGFVKEIRSHQERRQDQ